MCKKEEILWDGLVWLLAPDTSPLQRNPTKFKQNFVGSPVVNTESDSSHFKLTDQENRVLADVCHINELTLATLITLLHTESVIY